MGFKVTPEQLRRTGNDIVATADVLNANVDGHSGAQDGDMGANSGLVTAKAVGECETSWEQALLVFGTRMAVAGDKLVVNAEQYASVEQANASAMAGH